MSKLMARIERGEILVADGATGTYLFSHGLEPGACPDACSLEHPDWLADLAEAAAQAEASLVAGDLPAAADAYAAAAVDAAGARRRDRDFGVARESESAGAAECVRFAAQSGTGRRCKLWQAMVRCGGRTQTGAEAWLQI